MKIQEQDQFHGSALTQITEHKIFKALNRGSSSYGHYLINADRHLFIKYRKPKPSPWTFIFATDELKVLRSIASKHPHVFLCLVCSSVTICALNLAELNILIDISASTQQWIKVTVPSGGSCHVTGSVGKLSKTVPHNAFPEKVFA